LERFMPYPPFKPRLCRQQGCVQGAGQSGLCPRHLRGSLQRHSLSQLLDILEVMLEPPAPSAPLAADAVSPDPLLN
jgi:hypothetical protein